MASAIIKLACHPTPASPPLHCLLHLLPLASTFAPLHICTFALYLLSPLPLFHWPPSRFTFAPLHSDPVAICTFALCLLFPCPLFPFSTGPQLPRHLTPASSPLHLCTFALFHCLFFASPSPVTRFLKLPPRSQAKQSRRS